MHFRDLGDSGWSSGKTNPPLVVCVGCCVMLFCDMVRCGVLCGLLFEGLIVCVFIQNVLVCKPCVFCAG